MAGAGYKLFNTGDVLTAAQVNTYLQEQTVMVFASSTARTTALSGVLAEGMVSYLQDTNAVEVYNGSAWVGVSGAGDVTEVQAGTGISVASGTGPIPVVTNTMATAIDAKGDLVVGTGADTFARLAVGGTNGHTLQVDSSTATGLKWAAAAASSFSGVSVKATGDQTIANNTEVVLTWDSEVFDTDAYHSNVTNNSRLTVPVGKAGKYQINAQISFDVNGTGRRAISFRKNGTTIKYSPDVVANASIYVGNDLTIIADLAEGDYIELVVYQNSGGNLTCFKAGSPGVNIFEMNYLGA